MSDYPYCPIIPFCSVRFGTFVIIKRQLFQTLLRTFNLSHSVFEQSLPSPEYTGQRWSRDIDVTTTEEIWSTKVHDYNSYRSKSLQNLLNKLATCLVAGGISHYGRGPLKFQQKVLIGRQERRANHLPWAMRSNPWVSDGSSLDRAPFKFKKRSLWGINCSQNHIKFKFLHSTGHNLWIKVSLAHNRYASVACMLYTIYQ